MVCRLPLAFLLICKLVLRDFSHNSPCSHVSQCMIEAVARCSSLGSKRREVVLLVQVPRSLTRIICLISGFCSVPLLLPGPTTLPGTIGRPGQKLIPVALLSRQCVGATSWVLDIFLTHPILPLAQTAYASTLSLKWQMSVGFLGMGRPVSFLAPDVSPFMGPPILIVCFITYIGVIGYG